MKYLFILIFFSFIIASYSCSKDNDIDCTEAEKEALLMIDSEVGECVFLGPSFFCSCEEVVNSSLTVIAFADKNKYCIDNEFSLNIKEIMWLLERGAMEWIEELDCQ